MPSAAKKLNLTSQVLPSSEESITCKRIEENQEIPLLLFHKKSPKQKVINLALILEANNVKKVTHPQNIKIQIQFLSHHIAVESQYIPAKIMQMNSSPITVSHVTEPSALNAPFMDCIKITRF